MTEVSPSSPAPPVQDVAAAHGGEGAKVAAGDPERHGDAHGFVGDHRVRDDLGGQGGAEDAAGLAGGHRAGADGGGADVVRRQHHRDTCGQAGLRGCRCADRRDPVVVVAKLGQEPPSPLQAVELEQPVGPVAPPDVHERCRCVRLVDGGLARQLQVKPATAGQQMARSGHPVGIVLAQPGQYGVGHAGGQPRPADPEGLPRHPVALPRGDLGGGSSVVPQHGGPGGTPLAVDQPGAVALCGDGDHAGCVGERFDDFPDGVGNRGPDFGHVLLGPPGTGSRHLGRPAAHRQLLPVVGVSDHLDGGGARVDGDRSHLHHPRPCAWRERRAKESRPTAMSRTAPVIMNR